MSEVYEWSTAAASNTFAPPDGAPEGMTPANLNNVLRELMAAWRRFYGDPEFVNLSDAFVVSRPTTSQVRVAGVDQTTLYQTGARVKMTGGAAAQYGFIFSCNFTAGNTNINIITDGLVAIDAATNAIWLHATPTVRSAAFATIGTGAGQIPTADDIPLVCARARATAPKITADQLITASGIAQITIGGGSNFIAVPGADDVRDYMLSVCLQVERSAVSGTIHYKFQVRLGLNGTTADPVIFEQDLEAIDASTHGVFTIANLAEGLVDVPTGSRLSFSLEKVAGASGVGYTVKGTNAGAKKNFSYFVVEEAL